MQLTETPCAQLQNRPPPLTIICLIEMLVSRLAMYYVRAHVNDALTASPNLTVFLSNVKIIQCWLELSNSNSNSPPFQPSLKASTTTIHPDTLGA